MEQGNGFEPLQAEPGALFVVAEVDEDLPGWRAEAGFIPHFSPALRTVHFSPDLLLVLGQGLILNLLVLVPGFTVHPRPSLFASTWKPAPETDSPPCLGLEKGFSEALGAVIGKIAASYSASSSLCSNLLALSEIARLRMQPSITSWARRILCADAA